VAEMAVNGPWCDTRCFVPAVLGPYWLQPLGYRPEIVVLDMADATRPREVSRLRLPDGDVPHWLATSDNGRRVLTFGDRGARDRGRHPARVCLQQEPSAGRASGLPRRRENSYPVAISPSSTARMARPGTVPQRGP
jgi:hypothetical protein